MKCHGDTAYNNHMPWLPNGAVPAGETVTEEKNKSLPALRKQNRMRLRALGEGGKLTQPLCLVMFSLPLCFSFLDFKLCIAHQVGALLEKQHWTWSRHCTFGDRVGKKIVQCQGWCTLQGFITLLIICFIISLEFTNFIPLWPVNLPQALHIQISPRRKSMFETLSLNTLSKVILKQISQGLSPITLLHFLHSICQFIKCYLFVC